MDALSSLQSRVFHLSDTHYHCQQSSIIFPANHATVNSRSYNLTNISLNHKPPTKPRLTSATPFSQFTHITKNNGSHLRH